MYLAMFFGAKDFNQVKPSLHPSKIYLAMLPLCRGLQSGGWGVGGSSGRRHSRSGNLFRSFRFEPTKIQLKFDALQEPKVR